MPYDSIKELPDQVKDPLPKPAQEIFKEAFNSAEDQYDKEETAFKVAWSAVKNEYRKDDSGNWIRK